MKKLSEEHKKKLSLAKLGKKHTKQHNINIGLGGLGLKRSQKIKDKFAKIKTGEGNPNWKGGVARYRSVHSVLAKRYGKANFCENKEYRLFSFFCTEKSIRFDWAKKKDAPYTVSRDDYYQLCRSCHHRYDRKS